MRIRDRSGIFRFYHDSRLELLRRTLPGVFFKQKSEERARIPLALHRSRLYRTLHDGFRRLDHRGYLQRPDGDSEYDRADRPERRRRPGDEGLFRTA